jgi:predicted DNA-binding transcriptional regulator AlpA
MKNKMQITILVNYRELEILYGLKKSTITKLVMYGKFCNVVKVGNKNYFRTKDVESWIDEQTIKVGS